MSLAELKRAVEVLSAEERLELAEHLRSLGKQNDPTWREEIGRRLDRSLSGEAHSQDELREAHERLNTRGQ